MKMILREKRALGVLAVIFVLSMLLGLSAPLFALDIAANESGSGESADNSGDSAPYVVFGGEELSDGRISGPNQGKHEFVEDGFTFLRFAPEYPEGKSPDPYISFLPGSGYSADEYKYVSVIVRADGDGSKLNFHIYYIAGEDVHYKGDHLSRGTFATGEGWQVITYDLSSSTGWNGEIKRLRLDVTTSKHLDADGNAIPFDIAAVVFSKSPQDVYDGAFEALTEMYKPEQTLSDFLEGEEDCFSASSTKSSILHNTKVTVRDGNVMLEGIDELKDPYAGFQYQELMDKRGVEDEDRLTTADFSNTVIRFRAGKVSDPDVLELFLFTGDHFAPFQISDGKGGKAYAQTNKQYNPTKNYGWQCLSLKMNEKKNEEAWQGAFNGFRIDWCKSPGSGGYMEISDILFYADDASAAAVESALNTVQLPLSRVIPTENPFLTPLEKSSEWIVLDPVDIEVRLSSPEGVSHEVTSTDGKKSVAISSASDTDHAYVEMDVKGIDILNHKYLSVLVKNSADFENFVVYYRSENGEYAANSSTAAAYEELDGWQVLTFLLDERAFEGGDVVSLRLDFAGSANCEAGDGIEMGAMAFSVRSDSAYDAAYYMLSRVYVPVQILTDFTSADAKYFDTATSGVKTTVAATDGNLVYSATAAGADPGKMFSYVGYAAAKDINPVTTKDFRYTVVRYRSQGISSSNAVMEMFLMTGDAKSLYDMASICEVDPETGKITKMEHRHRGRAVYSGDTGEAWRTVCIDMAAGDGYETSTNLKYGWLREDGNYTFQGFRMDWCSNTGESSVLQVSDLIFYQNESDARDMSAALSAVKVPVYTVTPPDDDDFPFDDDTDTETETETESDTLPDLNDSTEETVPDYVESSEESSTEPETESYTESSTESDGSSEESSTESDSDESPEESSTETESDVSGEAGSTEGDGDREGGSEESGIGDILDTDDEEGNSEGEGSQLPFYFACGALVVLSIASIIAVVLIKSRSAKSETDQ